MPLHKPPAPGDGGGGSRAAAQKGWGAARVPQNQSTLKPEQAAPRACLLQAGATPVSSPLSSVHGGLVLAFPWAGAAVGLAPAREPLCLDAGGLEGSGGHLPAPGPPAHLAAAGTVMSDCSSVPVPHGHHHGPASAPCRARVSLPAWQHIAACTLPSGSCRFLAGETARPAPSGCAGGAGSGLSPFRKRWHCPE